MTQRRNKKGQFQRGKVHDNRDEEGLFANGPDALRNEITTLTTTNTTLRNQIIILENSIIELKNDLEENETQINSFNQRINGYKSKIKQINQNHDKNQKELLKQCNELQLQNDNHNKPSNLVESVSKCLQKEFDEFKVSIQAKFSNICFPTHINCFLY